MSGLNRGFRRHEQSHGNQERWLITYADLITLLLVFFVVMYSMSMADSQKFRNVAGALNRAFNIDVLQGQTSAALLDQGALVTAGDAADADSLPWQEPVFPDASVPGLQALHALTSDYPGITVYQRAEGVAVRLSGSLLFASGSGVLRMEGARVLGGLAHVLATTWGDVRIEGHTDNVPTTSPVYASNWELSSARALAVVQYLQSIGVAPERLSAAGFGEHRPIASNGTPQGRASNRRAEIVLVSPSSPDTRTTDPVAMSLPQRGEPR